MQPTENKHPSHEELIAHIRKNLKVNEEPYKLGAWENFKAKQQTKRTPIFWITRLAGVAAIIAVCFSFFLFTRTNPVKTTNNLVKINPDKIEEKLQNAITNDHLEKLEVENSTLLIQGETKATTKNLSQQLAERRDDFLAKPTDVTAINESVVANFQQDNQLGNQVKNKDIIDQNSNQEIALIAEEKLGTNSADFLNKEPQKKENLNEKIFKNSSKSKWVLGLMVAPSLGNAEELNMGYGISMGYNLSDKLSLITGVSYNEMSASKDFTNNIGTSSILYGNNKSLAAISQKVTGLDIPLELKYSFNKNLYASLGVSAFAVIRQSRSNTFIQGVVVNRATNKANSSSEISVGASSVSRLSDFKGQFANTYILNKKIVERANLEDQNNANYLGFYNFSFGYKKKMLKNHFVAFEPFLKLPIRNASQDNLKLVGTGLRVKVDF